MGGGLGGVGEYVGGWVRDACAPKATKAHDFPPPGPPAIIPKSPCPKPPQSNLLIKGHGVSTVFLASSLNRSSSSVTYS